MPSKTHNPACSQAMSVWVKSRHGGPAASPDVFKILGKCRAMARQGKKAAAAVTKPKETAVTAKVPPTLRPKGGEATAEKSKFVGEVVGKREHVYAEKREKEIARHLGGKQLKDNEPLDVRVPKAGDGGGHHAVEVKSLLKGKKQAITVHDDALLRKVKYQADHPDSTFHTVVLDHRHKYDRGAHKEHHSGHDLYYKRGSGHYALSAMHKVDSHEDLKRLLHTPDHLLPEKAQGALPGGDRIARLEESATRAHASRLTKDRARKQRIKAARRESNHGL